MTAELLRRAAAKMREAAEGATPGPWSEWGVQPLDGERYDAIGNDETEREVCSFAPSSQASADSWHIASWHPAVALAVADWLDDHAAFAEQAAKDFERPELLDAPDPLADKVARLYLGES
jgi:hypothetical protein